MARLFVASSDQKAVASSVPVTDNPFSISCWFNITDTETDATWPIIGFYKDDDEYLWLGAHKTSATRKVRLYRVTSLRANTDNQWVPGTWHHLVVTSTDLTTRTLSMDGGDYDYQAGNLAPFSSGSIDIGYNEFGTFGSEYLDGSVAEVAIWNVALSAAEKAALAAGYVAPFIRPSALVFYAPMWGYHNPEIELLERNTLTLTNSPTASNHPRVRGLRRLGRFDDSSIAMLMGHYLAYSGGTLL